MCGKDCDRSELEKHITDGKVYYCADCKGPVKPNITFFGEQLPMKFKELLVDLTIEKEKYDLMIVIGTALAVAPFNRVVKLTNCP